jgi:hypothetical protein
MMVMMADILMWSSCFGDSYHGGTISYGFWVYGVVCLGGAEYLSNSSVVFLA